MPAHPRGLLSYRQAAKLLGVDRNTTLHDMVETGQIKAVTIRRVSRIPLAEVVRILRGEDAWDLSV